MCKTLIALAAVTAAAVAPAVASTAHDFDPSNVRTARSLDGQCYKTNGDSKVCFFRITGETFAVSINDAKTASAYPQVFTVNCDTGRYKGFGPMENANSAGFAQAFCDSGRY